MQKKLNETMDNAYPINPKKNSGALGYLFYAYWATIGGPQSSLIPHPPTYGVDPYNGAASGKFVTGDPDLKR